MLTILSTIGSFLVSGLPSLLKLFQDKSDKKHEIELARMQTERELQMAKEGYLAQAKVEEIRSDQIAMESHTRQMEAIYDHDKNLSEGTSQWVKNLRGSVRPMVTYLFVIELILVNFAMVYWAFVNGAKFTTIDDLLKFIDLVFSAEEMAMLGSIIAFWFGSQQWNKK